MRYLIGFVIVIVLVVLIPVIAERLPTGFSQIYRRAAQEGLSRPATTTVLTEADLAHLPAPVQRYVRYSGAVGKPRVRDFHATIGGEMCREQGAAWTKMTAEQYNFYDEPTRLFLMKSSLSGVPFDGLHVYRGPSATMRIRVGSVIQVVNAAGPKMNQGETVTMLNDMCFLAPATLIDPSITWEPIDDLHAKATFTNAGNAISAVLTFNEADQLVDFYSDDRFMSADGKTYKSYRWSTPISDYRDVGDGRRIASKGEAVWDTPTGKYSYIKFDIKDIAYNLAAQ
jgi:hypothetical protein